jgi:hypothetical protein
MIFDRRVWGVAVYLLAACGDDGRAEADASLSGTTTAPTGPTMPTTSGTPTDAGTDSLDGTGSSTSSPTTSSTSSSSSGSMTDPFDPACVEMGPPGHPGPSDPTCAAEPQFGAFNPVLEWHHDVWAVEPTSVQILMTPIVASLDDDDIPDVLFVTYSGADNYGPGVLRAMSGDGTKEILNIAGAEVCGHSGLAAGDIDGDGLVEIVAITVDFAVKVFEHDGTPKWKSAAYGIDVVHCGAYASIADLDADGTPEIVVGAVILNADGSERGVGAHGKGLYVSVAADIDEDGVQEVVVGNAAYDDVGATIWFNGESDGFPGLANFTGDGKPEIVVSNGGTVRLQDNTGVVLWSTPVPDGGGGAPTIADYDGDGQPEAGVAGSEYYVVFDGDGSVLWQAPISETASATGSVVHDFEGDGVADVIHADENRVWVFSGIDGSVKMEFAPHGSGTQFESPAVVDVDGDGQAEIVFGNNQYYGPDNPVGISVIGDMDMSWRPARKIWNQYSYYITNVDDDGGIPTVPEYNWTKYNNFRSGDTSPPDGKAAPDVALEGFICQVECIESNLQVWINVGNEGASPLTAGATIEVYGKLGPDETLIASQPFALVLAPGTYADAIGFMVADAGYDSLVVRAVANEEDCKPGNNELTFAPPFCNPPG